MYELAYLKRAFDAKSFTEIIRLIVDENPPEIETTYVLRSISNQLVNEFLLIFIKRHIFYGAP